VIIAAWLGGIRAAAEPGGSWFEAAHVRPDSFLAREGFGMKEPIIRTHNREIDELFERYRRAPGSHVFAPLADAYRKLGLVEEALDICARGLSANPRYASGYVVQGKCQYDAGRADRAEASFRKVLDIDPNNLVALRYLGIIRAGCGDTEGARGFFEQILTLDPGDKDVRQRLDEVQENAEAPANSLVDEIEGVLQAERPVAAAAKPALARVGDDDEDEDGEDEDDDDENDDDDNDDDVMELRDTKEDFEGSPILLGDDSMTSEYIATVTLADIFASQGYTAKALRIYKDVLRRQPDNDEVRRKIAALDPGESIIALGQEAAPKETTTDVRAPEPTAVASAAPASATPLAPASAAIDEGRSYEQFKRWLRTVSD
jgi:tetratricopeptide (TPR) repeat protein